MAQGWVAEAMTTSSRAQVKQLPRAPFGVLRLGRVGASAAIAAAGAALGLALPATPNRAIGSSPRALWTGPLEWTLIDAAPAQLAGLRQALAASLAHYADLTDGRVGFLIEGPDAADLIESECPLDLRTLAPNACAQSLFADVAVLIERRDDEDGFRLYADASLGDHLAAWLAAAGEGLA
jgi:heterotetrameric sarcosine oxidase gamma subunit